jgi:protein gp37
MSDKTGISWCDATFNPWWGCQKVSPACDHCYAERDAKRFTPGRVLWGVGSERRTFGDARWQAPLKWAKQSFVECMGCGWRGASGELRRKSGLPGFDRDPGPMAICGQCLAPLLKEARRRVFCASMGDWLDLDAPLDEFVRLLDTIRRTPELDWLLLTKRIGNWRKRMEQASASITDRVLFGWVRAWLNGDAPANVVLMATVINQEEADRDVVKLLAIPARRRGLSIEPMLGPIDLTLDSLVCTLCPHCAENGADPDTGTVEHCRRCEWTGKSDEWGIDWVIAGGESGPHARPAHPDWFRSLRDQCAAAGVAFHFKQHGEWLPTEFCDDKAAMLPSRRTVYVKPDGSFVPFGGDVDFFGGAEETAWVGKAAAGRLLDGVEHNGFPS